MLSGMSKPEMIPSPHVYRLFLVPNLSVFVRLEITGKHSLIVPIVGSGLFAVGVVTLFNSLYTYLGITYSKYAASIFAGSALFRASIGTTFPLFVRQENRFPILANG